MTRRNVVATWRATSAAEQLAVLGYALLLALWLVTLAGVVSL